ncbi:hypothetical protein LZC95_12070 [Pendulispora brunnea]|uniref:Lipoprotein n=1 Tax=Pendulispora brunnea TaxID=2905690 RepID=A0ABZ2KJ02_9BACT
MRVSILGACLSAAMAWSAAGCSDDNKSDPGPADSGNPGQDSGSGTDAGSDAGTKFGGNAILVNLSTKVSIGGTPTPVRVLKPVVGFSALGSLKHQYDGRQGLFGCYADHFGVGQNLGSDSNAGTVTITDYSQANFLDGTPAPKEINCTPMNTSGLSLYQCGYGPLEDGKPGLTVNTPYRGDAQLTKDKQVIHVKVGGGSDIGAIDTAAELKAVDGAQVEEDLATIKYDPSKDTTLHVKSCDSCGLVTAVNIIANQNAPDKFDEPSATSGAIVCTFLGYDPIVIKKEAISAMFGGDAALKSVQTSIVRFGYPLAMGDTKGSSIQFAAGGGVIGVAPR